MLETSGFDLKNVLSNEDVVMTFTPKESSYSFSYKIYKDGKVILTETDLYEKASFNFVDEGIYNIEVVVKENNITKKYTNKCVIDKTKPVIELKTDNIVITQGEKFDVLENVKVTDNYCKKIGNHLTTNVNEINFDTLGVKKVVYIAVDKAGNKTIMQSRLTIVEKNNDFYISTLILPIILFLSVFLLFKYRRKMNIKKRISKFSINTKVTENISIVDIILNKISNILNFLSKYLDKSKTITKYSDVFKKHTVLYNCSSTYLLLSRILISSIGTFIYYITKLINANFTSLLELFLIFILVDISINIYNTIRYKNYLKKIENDLLRAIIIMNNAFRSGRSISQAVFLVNEQLDGPISKEFSKIEEELTYGLDLSTVFKRFADRIDLEEAVYLSASLSILSKTGGNIIKVFSAIEKSLYSKKKLRQELRTLTSASRVIKNVLLILPITFFIIISLIDNTYFTPLFNTLIGNIILVVIILLQVIYMYFVNKMMKVRM